MLQALHTLFSLKDRTIYLDTLKQISTQPKIQILSGLFMSLLTTLSPSHSLSLNFVNSGFGFSSEPRKEQITPGHANHCAMILLHQRLWFGKLHLFALVPVQPLYPAAGTTCSSLAAVPVGDTKGGFTAAWPSSWAGSAEQDRTGAGTSRAPPAPRWRQGTAEAQTPAPPGIAPPRPARPGGRSRRPRWAGASRQLNVSGERTPTPPVLRPPSRRTGRAGNLGPGGAAGNPRASALPRTHRAPRERGKARGVPVAPGSPPEEGRAALPADLALVRLLQYVRMR